MVATFLSRVLGEIRRRSRGSVDFGSFYGIVRQVFGEVFADGKFDENDYEAIIKGLEELVDNHVDIPYVPEFIEDRVLIPLVRPMFELIVKRLG